MLIKGVCQVPIMLVDNVFTTSHAEDLMSAIAEVAFFEWEIIVVESECSS